MNKNTYPFRRDFVPIPEDDERKIVVTSAAMPPEMRRRLERVARRHGTTLSCEIRDALDVHLDAVESGHAVA